MPAPTSEELLARIAARVREQAERRGFTLDRLAKDAGISRTTLYYITTARAAVTAHTLAKLGLALDVDPVVFLRPYKPAPAVAGETSEPAGAHEDEDEGTAEGTKRRTRR